MEKTVTFQTRDVLITLSVLIGMNIVTVVTLIVLIVMSKRRNTKEITTIEMTTINPTDVGGEGVKDDTLTDVKVGGGETKTENNEEKEDVIYAEIHKK